MKSVKVTSVQEFLKELENVSTAFSQKNKLFYHGLFDNKWKLEANVFRGEYSERTICLDFKQYATMMGVAYDPYLDCDKMLMDMQHNRIPTRMLDWTLNPLVALYFACVEDVYTVLTLAGKKLTVNESDGVVWVFDPWRYYKSIVPDPSIPRIHDAHLFARSLLSYGYEPDYVCAEANKRYGTSLSCCDLRLPFPVVSPFTNKRKLAQEGCFTIPGTYRDDMASLDEFKRNAVCITIAQESKGDIEEQLNRVGINDFTIYPDVDGFARQVARTGGLFRQANRGSKK